MSSLRDLQQRFYRTVILDENVFVGSRHAASRLEVYRNNARETFRRTLAATHPVLMRLVGEECFRSLARECMRELPSRSGDLAAYGAEFPSLLDIYYRDTLFAYLADVARLERAIAVAEIAADASPLDHRRLGSIDPADYPALRFVADPAAQLVTSRWPVLAIWRAHQSADVEAVELGAGAEHVLVTRVNGRIALHGVDAATFAFARSLADDEPLGDALVAGLAADAHFDVSSALAQLAALRVFSDFRLASYAVA